ncbi:MAG: SdrD B-like domain-containing protein, partial [Phycisphaerae bacterium]
GTHAITATQTVPGFSTSTASAALTITVRTTPPGVASQSPTGAVVGAQTDVIFTFNEAVDPTSFSLATGVGSFTGPNGDLRSALGSATWSGGNTILDVKFAAQSAAGAYQMILNAGLRDLAGNVMTAAYTAPFTIDNAVYTAGMDTNPGWTFDAGSLWQWGAATVGSSSHNHDPGVNASGISGGGVLGYNIGGDYAVSSTIYYATTPTFDCSNDSGVYLSYSRWLGVRSTAGATIQISVDNGTTWSTVWTSNGATISDTSWQAQSIRLTAADGKSQVKLRWSMGPVPSGKTTYPGWSIDNVLVYGTPLASISGQVFLDSNGGGTLNNGEVGLNGVTVYIDTNNNGVWNTGEPTTVTSGNGNYTFTKLAASSYTVREVLPAGYIATQPPASSFTIALAIGANASGYNFGNFPSVFTASTSSTSFTLDRSAGGSQIQVISQTLAGGSPTTYTIDSSLLSTLSFTGSAGDDTLTIDFTNGNPLPSGGITFNGGGHVAGDAILIHGNPAVNTVSVTGTQIALGAVVVNYSNVQHVVFDSDLGGTGTLPAVAVGAAGVTFTANEHLDSLTLNAGGTVQLANAGGQLLTVNTLNFSGGILDLTKNSLLVHQSTLTAIRTALAGGYQNGTWAGAGLSSSYAQSHSGRGLGYLRGDIYNALHNNGLFAGATVAAGDIVVQCTWQGDVDLSGSVSALGFAQMDVSFLRGGTNATWLNGDWNYDGQVLANDFTLINAALQLQAAGPLVAATVVAAVQPATTAAAPASMPATESATPTPAAVIPVIAVAAPRPTPPDQSRFWLLLSATHATPVQPTVGGAAAQDGDNSTSGDHRRYAPSSTQRRRK